MGSTAPASPLEPLELPDELPLDPLLLDADPPPELELWLAPLLLPLLPLALPDPLPLDVPLPPVEGPPPPLVLPGVWLLNPVLDGVAELQPAIGAVASAATRPMEGRVFILCLS